MIEVDRVGRRAKTCRKLSLLGIFSRLGSFPQVLGQTKRCPILELHEILKLPHVVAFTIFFYFLLWSSSTCRIAQTYEKWPFLKHFQPMWSVSSRFWQVIFIPVRFFQTQIILHFMKIKKGCIAFASLFFLLFFWYQSGQGVVLKLNKNGQFKVFWATWVLFPKFLSRLKSSLH